MKLGVQGIEQFLEDTVVSLIGEAVKDFPHNENRDSMLPLVRLKVKSATSQKIEQFCQSFDFCHFHARLTTPASQLSTCNVLGSGL